MIEEIDGIGKKKSEKTAEIMAAYSAALEARSQVNMPEGTPGKSAPPVVADAIVVTGKQVDVTAQARQMKDLAARLKTEGERDKGQGAGMVADGEREIKEAGTEEPAAKEASTKADDMGRVADQKKADAQKLEEEAKRAEHEGEVATAEVDREETALQGKADEAETTLRSSTVNKSQVEREQGENLMQQMQNDREQVKTRRSRSQEVVKAAVDKKETARTTMASAENMKTQAEGSKQAAKNKIDEVQTRKTRAQGKKEQGDRVKNLGDLKIKEGEKLELTAEELIHLSQQIPMYVVDPGPLQV